MHTECHMPSVELRAARCNKSQAARLWPIVNATACKELAAWPHADLYVLHHRSKPTGPLCFRFCSAHRSYDKRQRCKVYITTPLTNTSVKISVILCAFIFKVPRYTLQQKNTASAAGHKMHISANKVGKGPKACVQPDKPLPIVHYTYDIVALAFQRMPTFTIEASFRKETSNREYMSTRLCCACRTQLLTRMSCSIVAVVCLRALVSQQMSAALQP